MVGQGKRACNFESESDQDKKMTVLLRDEQNCKDWDKQVEDFLLHVWSTRNKHITLSTRTNVPSQIEDAGPMVNRLRQNSKAVM